MQPSHKKLYEQAINEHNKLPRAFSVNEINVQDAWINWTKDEGIEHLQYSNSETDYNKLRKKIHIHRLNALEVKENIEIISDRIIELESNTNFYILYEDTIEILSILLQNNIKMGIVSNHLWNLKDITKSLGLNKYFNSIISSAQIGYRKPHPAIYKAALSEINASPEDVLFIGDNLESDYLGPKNVGLSAVLLDRNGKNQMSESIKSLNELSKML
jgi:putative hydrolase of the HAD superfamily